MLESIPAVMKKATSKTSTTPRASRLCARPGDKLERMKCCSSGTTAAVFTIGATPRSGWNGDEEFLDMASLFGANASLVGEGFIRDDEFGSCVTATIRDRFPVRAPVQTVHAQQVQSTQYLSRVRVPVRRRTNSPVAILRRA